MSGSTRQCIFLLLASALFAQNEMGELRLTVTDQSGLAVPAEVELRSAANDYSAVLQTDREGKLAAKRLPFGIYQLKVRRAGFSPYVKLVEIRSALPVEHRVVLEVAGVETTVVITESETLIDPHRIGSNNRIGSNTLRDRTGTQPGRSVVELINTQPGWLLEANAVLHPRGSEYQTQYVVNGIPLTDNRSPSFAPEIEADEVQSMNVLTANYPAEYGRKLGGIVEVTTVRDSRPGFHGRLSAGGGSFDSMDTYASGQYGWGRNTFSLSGGAGQSDRYLDPPVEQNYTNRGTTGNFAAHYERDLTTNDRIGLIVRREQSRFLVPNEQVQQLAGQRQDRTSYQTSGQVSYQHVFSPNWLGDIRAMGRDVSANLWSNALATPIIATQNRGFREVYLKATVAAHQGRHEWKAGVEADFGSVREVFSYRITNRSVFDRDTARRFDFAGRAQDREQALFLQDLVRFGNWTFSAGLRWDHYHLMLNDHAISPRLGAAWYWRGADMVLRASYDRAYQTPAIENLLLASSPATAALNDNVLRLPVPPSTGDFLEAGFTKGLFGKLRMDANWFRRSIRNFADDDLLLNTGVSFPIAFRKARIHGIEVKLDIPRWGPLSGSVGYSNLTGVGYLPITGGLFLGDEAGGLLRDTSRFAITQDQRNTGRGRLRYQVTSRIWAAFGATYGSGLPVEFEGTRSMALTQYGEAIVDRVNFDRGRVRPSLALDASAGADVWKREKRSLRFQADLRNLTDRLNVINFAGLFSGTAVAAPRSVSVRLTVEF